MSGPANKTSSFSDTELKVMNIVWDAGGAIGAREIYHRLRAEEGYTQGTVYKLIGRCIEKGGLAREDPGFLCRAIVERGAIQAAEAERLVDKLFDGSARRLVSALVDGGSISDSELDELADLIAKARQDR